MLCVNHHNHSSRRKTEKHQTLYAVLLAFVFACHCEVVPDCITSNKVKPVSLDVQLALLFVPGEHIYIASTEYFNERWHLT